MNGMILLTGATGLLGRYLLRDLTLRGAEIAVVVRGGKDQSAEARIESIMAGWEEELGRPLPRPHVLEGELTAPGLGLSDEALAWVARNCSQVLHNAASLTFHGADRGREPWRSNVAGTAQVVDVAREAGIPSFHHVSTAYVCGLRTDLVREDDAPEGPFRNDYEAAKAEGERRVRAAAFPGGVTIHRPAVIVGDSTTGYTSTYHGLYLYLQYLDLMSRFAERDAEGRWELPLRLNLTGDERRNLVPVDWVSAVMTEIVLRPELHGKTYHLAPTTPVTARELEEAMAARFGYTGITFAGARTWSSSEWNEAESAFYSYVSEYELYWESEPQFDVTNTRAAAPDLPCPRIDGPLVARLIDFAVRDRWGRGARRKRPVAGSAAAS